MLFLIIGETPRTANPHEAATLRESRPIQWQHEEQTPSSLHGGVEKTTYDPFH